MNSCPHPAWLLAISLLLAFVSAPLHAQYRVYAWESFEEGRLPRTLFFGHFADPQTVGIIDYRHRTIPRAMRMGIAPVETGQYGMIFRPVVGRHHLSVVSPVSLDRGRVGEEGRALYQADFYLPPEGQPIPTTALLAQVVEGGQTTYRFYRFGILEGGEQVFFSYTNNTAEPLVYLNQPTSELNLRRPGWNRFQIIFRGQEEIICAIDAEPTGFSPIIQRDLRRLNAGIMVTNSEPQPDRPLVVVADNLSIQWTSDDVPIPESPWNIELADASEPNRNYLDSGQTVFWLNDPRRAWQLANSQGRPILTLFHTPTIGPYRYLREIIPLDEATAQLLNRFVLLKVDVNQLGGGSLAERYRITRLPTFVVIGPDGQEEDRSAIVGNQTQWGDVRVFLEEALQAVAPPPAEEPTDEETAAE